MVIGDMTVTTFTHPPHGSPNFFGSPHTGMIFRRMPTFHTKTTANIRGDHLHSCFRDTKDVNCKCFTQKVGTLCTTHQDISIKSVIVITDTRAGLHCVRCNSVYFCLKSCNVVCALYSSVHSLFIACCIKIAFVLFTTFMEYRNSICSRLCALRDSWQKLVVHDDCFGGVFTLIDSFSNDHRDDIAAYFNFFVGYCVSGWNIER